MENNMSKLKQLKKKKKQLEKEIKNHIAKAKSKKIYKKAKKVAKELGDRRYMGRRYEVPGLIIDISRTDFTYLEIYIDKEDDEPVFGAKRSVLMPFFGLFSEIIMYDPGDWEKILEECYNKIPKIKEGARVLELELELAKLKGKWHLEEI